MPHPVIPNDYPPAVREALIDPNNTLCWKCQGSGKYYSGGAVVNGKYTGNVGTCYPCSGKGYQTRSDVKRTNYYYANHFKAGG